MCAHAVSVSIKKIQGIESVNVSLNNAMVTIALKPGNDVSLDQIRQAILDDGFTPKEAAVSAVGQLVSAGGKLKLKLTGTNETFDIAADLKAPSALDELKRQAGGTVLIRGVIPASNGREPAPVVRVDSVKAEQR